MRFPRLAPAIALLLLLGCETPGSDAPSLFVKHDTTTTGVTFSNDLKESPDFNILNYLYYYNGGGVAMGDVNGDGLPDLYFTANEGPNKLYLNRGDFQFEDVTDVAGVAGTADWTTGVTMTDVNADGRLDLYVSAVHGYLDLDGGHQLYVNQGPGDDGVPRFEDQAAQYGLDYEGFGTHSTFFDYDRDGDLDVYLLNHSVHDEKSYGRTSLRRNRDPDAGDRLLENRDGTFVDVSNEAGIFGGAIGYGLGVVVTDVDTDGWPDLYVANDFHENDYLYLNQQDGTFREVLTTSTGHTSRFSMGTDAGDVDNDGRPDVAVLDMLPDRESIRKTAVTAESYDLFQIKKRFGYHPQYARNVLLWNRGAPAASSTNPAPRFSDVGYLAGVEATDWSWAPLFADFDLDGRQDLFISNGIFRRPNDLDYINYISNRAVQESLQGEITEENLELLKRMPQVRIPNRAFHNDGDLRFSDRAEAWGLDHEGFSNGSAYGDLDGDGDLDLVVNNVGEPASIYENRADSLRDGHWLALRFDGAGANPFGIGARVDLVYGDQRQTRHHVLTRGYQSSVAPGLHVGLGDRPRVDTLTVTWPDGRTQTRTGVAADQTLTLTQSDAETPPPTSPSRADSPRRFATDSTARGIDFRHRENDFVDFNRERLMPHKLSTEGPALAVGDVNGDGRDDVFVGGAKWQSGQLFLQGSGGRFTRADSTAWSPHARREDVDAAFFDADGDDDLDLYVVSAGNEFWSDADALRDRLYLNDGSGGFRHADNALPGYVSNGGSVTPGDADGDGDVDLFVGGRVVARTYGATPESAILLNDGDGTFRDATDRLAPDLRRVGMVSDARWADVDGDGRLDLVVVGEWMPVTVFRQQPDGTFADATDAAGLATTHGWWNALAADDLDGDGDVDFVAGNLGLNALMDASVDEPVRLYRADFNDDGASDPILTAYRDGTPYPVASFDDLRAQMSNLKQEYPTYDAFGARRIDEFVSDAALDTAQVEVAQTFASAWLENAGDGTFTVHALPTSAQVAPLHGISTGDVDGDGQTDLLLGGNFYGVTPTFGRYDASYGHYLRGVASASGVRFDAVDNADAGLWLDGQVRALRIVRTDDGGRLLVAARNDDTIQVVRVRTPEPTDRSTLPSTP